MSEHLLVTAIWMGVVVIVLGLSFAGRREGKAFLHYDEASLSPPGFRVRMENNVRIPMRDGVELSADIYRPDAEGKFPTVLLRIPYSNDQPRLHVRGRFFAERGYVVVMQDTRGRYDSDGTFYPFRNELDDGYDTDEWLGRQPWSNGRIGAIGGSYDGLTQLCQAIRGSPYLTAIVPRVAALDIYGRWAYIGGAFQYALALMWGNYIDGRVNQEISLHDWPKVFRHLPILTADQAVGRRLGFYRDWVKHPTRDAYWEENSFEKGRDQVAVPTLNLTGWYDLFLLGQLADHVEIREKGKTEVARKNNRLVIGPWVHDIGERSTFRAENPGEKGVDFGPEAEVDLSRVMLRWFDHWIKEMENGVKEEPPVKIFVMGENYWRYEQEWPLARTRYTKYYLRSGGQANSLRGDGRLSREVPEEGESADRYTYDPSDPVPTAGGSNCCWSDVVVMGPTDQRPVEWRQDVLVYTSEELSEPLEVTGPITVKLFASTSGKDTDWTAKLVDVHPSGLALNLQDGIVRARYRESDRQARLIEPGRVYEYTIDLWATSNTFLPGHRIRIEIASSNFPRFDRNLNTGEDTGTGTAMLEAKQSVYHNARYPSHIVLPVIPRG